jgi:hypothetical protein
MTEYLTAWECIGCGRVEVSRPCIGVCQDRKAEFVYARDYEAAVRRAEEMARQLKAAKTLLNHFANTTPRAGQWERCFKALQNQAARCLSSLSEVES